MQLRNNETPLVAAAGVSNLSVSTKELTMNSLAKSNANNTQTSAISQFHFDTHAVRVLSIHNEPWFVAADLCRVLELSNPTKAIMNLDDDEKALTSIQGLSRGNEEANIVSESGMYTLILRCRDAVKPGTIPHRVRKWVTAEVLPAIRKTGSYGSPRKSTKKALPGKITIEQQEAVKQLVMNRGKALPKENQAKAMITMWSALKNHFGCSYKEINEDQFTDALSLAARVPIEGEFLGKQEALPAPKLEVSLPIQWWFDNNPAVKYGNRENIAKMKQNHICFTPSLHVTIDMLCGDSDTSAAIQLINIMEMAGYDVSAPKAEIVAMRKHIANVEYGMKAISDACIRAKNKKVIFRGKKAEITIN
ncbi:phage antirepressor [Yersinia enterocolitica]|nr:phage antirepressor [Yersinia enterocolitica]